MLRNQSILLIMLLGLFLAPEGAAQSDPTDQPTEPDYTVEVIVLEYLDQPESAYRWPGEPATELALDLLPPLTGRGFSRDQTPGDPRFRLQDPSQLALNEAWNSLIEASAYQPLARLAWSQPLAEGLSIPVRVRNDRIISITGSQSFSDLSGDSDPSSSGPVVQVDGTVTFQQRRYRHIKLDLALRRPAPTEVPAPLESSTVGFAGLASLEPVLPYRTYRINDSRQISLDQVHYFDHRQFGVLVRVAEIDAD